MNNAEHILFTIRSEAWQSHIGGYQVIQTYLKDRKGCTLSLDEINNVENVANVLAFTIGQMKKIDAAYLKAFPEAEQHSSRHSGESRNPVAGVTRSKP